MKSIKVDNETTANQGKDDEAMLQGNALIYYPQCNQKGGNRRGGKRREISVRHLKNNYIKLIIYKIIKFLFIPSIRFSVRLHLNISFS